MREAERRRGLERVPSWLYRSPSAFRGHVSIAQQQPVGPLITILLHRDLPPRDVSGKSNLLMAAALALWGRGIAAAQGL